MKWKIGLGLVCALAALPLAAGPPLLCPPVVLTTDEKASLEALAVESEVAVDSFVAALSRSSQARFRIEALRWFFHRAGEKVGMLLPALERRAAAESATAQDRFDLALVRVMHDWEGDGARRAVCTMSEIADETGDPARLICAAEALDLVAHRGGDEIREIASRLALAHCRRAAASLLAADGDAETRRLLREHLPYFDGVHSRDPAWARLIASIEKE